MCAVQCIDITLLVLGLLLVSLAGRVLRLALCPRGLGLDSNLLDDGDGLLLFDETVEIVDDALSFGGSGRSFDEGLERLLRRRLGHLLHLGTKILELTPSNQRMFDDFE